jgi:methyl-accepting chemotaxis protein
VVALREIVTASAHTAQSINRISQISREMSSLSGQLNEATGQFKVGDQDKAAT